MLLLILTQSTGASDKLILLNWFIGTAVLCGLFLCTQLKACPLFVVELFQPAFVVCNLVSVMSLLIKEKIIAGETSSQAECWFMYIWFVTLFMLRTNWLIMATLMFLLRISLQVANYNLLWK